MKKAPRLLVPLILATAALLAGCGKSEAPASHATAAATPANGVREIEITANDAMKFSVTEIRAQAGEKLRVTLTNLGNMPKQAMGHNWVLLVPMDEAAVAALAQATTANAPEYIPSDATKIIVHTKLLGPKQSDTVEFEAPAAPGEYPYVCMFPGHAALMRGKLIVAPKS